METFRKITLTLLVTLLGVSISQLVALTEIEDCPEGSNCSNFAMKGYKPQVIKPGDAC